MLFGLLVVSSPFVWEVARWARRALRDGPETVRLEGGVWTPDAHGDRAFEAPGRVTGGWTIESDGMRWDGRVEPVPAPASLRDVASLLDGRVIAVGRGGVVLERSQAGAWSVIASGGPDLNAIAVSLSGRAYAAGARGVLVDLGPPVAVLAGGGGPDLTDLRFDEASSSFIGRVRPHSGGMWQWALFGLAAVALLVGVLILALTIGRLQRWAGARRIERLLGPVRAEVELDGDRLRYTIRAKVLESLPRGELTVRVIGYQVEVGSRSVRNRVERRHAIGAVPAGEVLQASGDAESMSGHGEVVLEVDLGIGRARTQLRASIPTKSDQGVLQS